MSNTGFINADLTVDYLLQGSTAGIFPIHVGTDPTVDYINTETFTVRFSQNQLTITFLLNHSYAGDSSTDGLSISDTTNNLAALQSVVADSSSTAAGYSAAISGDGNSILINWQGASFTAGQTITLDVGFASTTPPTASDAAVATGEDTPLRAAVPAAIGDGPVTYALDSSGSSNVVFHSNGSYSFDPTGAYEYLGAHETATVTFGYYAIGADGARSDTHTVTITINGQNDAPVLAPGSISLGAAVATQEQVSAFLSGVSDADIHDPHGIAITATGGSGNWQYSLDGTHWTTLTASDGAALLLDASDYVRFDASGPTTASLTYHAWDESSGVAGGTADLTVAGTTGGTAAFSTGTATASEGLNGANNPPIAIADTGSAGENETKSFDVLANDSDPDPANTISLVSIDGVVVHSANGSIDGMNAVADFSIGNINGLIQFNPGTQFDALAAGQTATVTVNYTIADNHGARASSSLTLTVNGVNDAPVLAPGSMVFDPAVAAAGEQVATFLSGVTDADVSATEGIAITAASGAGTWQYSLDDVNWTTLSNAADSTARLLGVSDFIRFIPTGNTSTTAAITYHAWDRTTGADGGTANLTNAGSTGGTTAFSDGVASRTIGLNGANNPPTANPDSYSAVEKGVQLFDVLANDQDLDQGDTIALSKIGSVTVVSSNPSVNGIDASSAFSIVSGQVQFDPGKLFQALAVGDTATVVVGYSIADNHGATGSSTLSLTVTGVEDPPVITSHGGTGNVAYSILEHTTAVATITATDPDVGDVVHFSIAGGADRSLFAIDPNSGALTFRSAPNYSFPQDADHNNVYQVVVQASDGRASAVQGVSVDIVNIPGVTIHVTKGTGIVNATHTVHGQPLPTNEEDLIIGGKGNDRLSGLGGNDTISGGMGSDVLNGGAGNDVLNGGWGINRLIGGPGNDTFVFNSLLNGPPNGKAYNFSTIADFNPVQDTIELSHHIFRGLAPGVLSAAAFAVGGGPSDTHDRIIYNPKTGYLLYDRDGSNFLPGIEFAKLSPHLHLTHSDFLVY